MELLAIAIAPAAILLFWVYQKDKYEREPLGLLFKIMVFGALACVPAAVLELIIEPLLMTGAESGMASLWGIFTYALLGVGLVEEGCKYFVLQQSTWRSRHFSQRFDGIVYAVSASLGFAVLENILYVMSGGFSVGILRALTAVPMHCAFGVLMGLQYGQDRFAGEPQVQPPQMQPQMQQNVWQSQPWQATQAQPPQMQQNAWQSQPWQATQAQQPQMQQNAWQSQPWQATQAQQPQMQQQMQQPMQPQEWQGQQVPYYPAYPVSGATGIATERPVILKKPSLTLWKAILVPTLLHGLYDFFAMASPVSAWFLLGLAVTLIFSVGWAAILVVRESKYA